MPLWTDVLLVVNTIFGISTEIGHLPLPYLSTHNRTSICDIRSDSPSTTVDRIRERCGASIINVDQGPEPREWEVPTGVLHFVDGKGLEGRLKRVQLWVDDAKGDGGAVGWINQGKLEGMDRHWQGRESEMVDDKTVKGLMSTRGRGAENENRPLLVQCKCQRVRFEVNRPDEIHNNGTGKYASSLDACTSCRTVTGFEITSWTTVPKEVIAAGMDLDTFLGDSFKLGHYLSSSNTSRYFCTTCGATVFYYRHGNDTIDIASGLFEPDLEGAVRVEAWLEWKKVSENASTDFVSFQGDAIDTQFVNNVAEGMKAWEKQIRT
ncbi:hypothetical protein H2200_010169 [Cladophialophora chaetospira]|uniref:CENP-V/GFA domain-containing protein n=1 Tax=Cladophialophora chaetospira TaxID=386627 RepID=A0AA39CET0_9EURO|nr:hypothetical protein H2200_010169 [Cladophialophora chaetospira]